MNRPLRIGFVSTRFHGTDGVSLEAAKWAGTKLPEIKNAGLIASAGAIEGRLFHKALAAQGIGIISPTPRNLERTMEAVFGSKGIKSGHSTEGPREEILSVAASLIERGAEAIIAGCTEIPLVLRPEDISVPLIDPMDIAARACVLKAGYELKEA